jgi:hypothetical protein
VDVLARRQIRGAALDITGEEPLPATSPLWAVESVLITPHTAGEICRYEDDVLAIMRENLARLWRGETELLNQVVYVCTDGPPLSSEANQSRRHDTQSEGNHFSPATGAAVAGAVRSSTNLPF